MSVELGAVLVPMVTPFDASGQVDEEAAVRVMHHLIEHGCDGLVICGTTGEAATLSDEEQLGSIGLAGAGMGPRWPGPGVPWAPRIGSARSSGAWSTSPSSGARSTPHSRTPTATWRWLRSPARPRRRST